MLTVIFLIICALAIFTVMFLIIFNKFLPKWMCENLHWHLPPKLQDFDGCSSYGTCPRCGKRVLKDSQGNWFEAE
jgi:hypothetical protein